MKEMWQDFGTCLFIFDVNVFHRVVEYVTFLVTWFCKLIHLAQINVYANYIA